MLPFPTTRVEISRSRLTGNFQYLLSLLQHRSPAKHGRNAPELLAVVKANAYGHGLSPCAAWLVQAGAKWLGVTSAEEGAAVRRLCPDPQILVMRGLLPGETEAVMECRLTPTVWESSQLQWLASAARKRQLGFASVPVHLEVDTGMSRQGVGLGKLRSFLDAMHKLPELRLAGIYTHYASAEVLDAEQNGVQQARFQQALEMVVEAGFRPQWIHAGSSSTILAGRWPEVSAMAQRHGARAMLRPGIALYGYAPAFAGAGSEAAEETRAGLKPVLTWKTAIASLRTVEAGATVGYNATFVAPAKMRLALLPVGYADGLSRKLSSGNTAGSGHVLIRGLRAPIVGRVSMDLTVVDVSDVPGVATGDEAVLIGEQDGQRVTADDHAGWAGTIPYEILCGISARVPRVACD